MPVSIYTIAIERGAKPDVDGALSAGQFDRLNLPFLAWCDRCHSTVSPINSYPSTDGFVRCGSCIGNDGYATTHAYLLAWSVPDPGMRISMPGFLSVQETKPMHVTDVERAKIRSVYRNARASMDRFDARGIAYSLAQALEHANKHQDKIARTYMQWGYVR